MMMHCCGWHGATGRQPNKLKMNLHRLLEQRRAAGNPVRVMLIGAGKFGSMFLAQVPHTPGLEVVSIVDLLKQIGHLPAEVPDCVLGRLRPDG